MSEQLISASRLSKLAGCLKKEIDDALQAAGWIEQSGEGWKLTDAGKARGGVYQESKQYGTYIAWPESIKDDPIFSGDAEASGDSLSATAIGRQLALSAPRVNTILSELGWIRKGEVKGWVLTDQGKRLGGIQKDHPKSGVPYVNWPAGILNNKTFRQSVGEFLGEAPAVEHAPAVLEQTGFREKFEAKHRASDGHFVRSKAEMLIDNWLYMAEIVHAYERKLPVEEEIYCDFYIPTGRVYVEYWGFPDDPKYQDRKRKKLEIYAKYGMHLIELDDNHVQNLDDILPAKLLKFGVRSI